MSVENLKAKVTKNIQYLKQCPDYASDKAQHAATETNTVLRRILDQPDKQKALAKHLATVKLGRLFNDIWKALSHVITQQHVQGYDSLHEFIHMFCYITDISDDVSKELGEAGCLKVMIEAMDKYRDRYTDDVDGLLGAVLVIVINAIQGCTENVSIYRKSNAITIFKRYLNSDNMVTKMRSLRILAHIVDENESSLLQTTNDGVGFLLSLVKDAVSNEDHREYGIAYTRNSALELLRGLNKLAVNDANKRIIARPGGIPVFTKMLTNEFSEDEKCAAVQALLNMSFIEELRKSEELKKPVKGLEKLAMSSNQHLQQMSTYALWQIKGQHLTEQTSGHTTGAPPSYEEAMTQPTRSTKPNAQVMISYQWDNQKTTKKLRDLLVQAGYQVWMDVTHLRGSLLEAMAKAVESSSLILLCMSEQYKNSEPCRAEAEYAFRLKKPIVPLLLEPEYKPDGWLGMLATTKLYYQVTSPEDLESKMAEILAGIHAALGGSDDVDGPIQATRQDVTSQEPSPTKKPVRQWSKDDVQEWLSDYDLPELCEAFKRMKGRHLQKMYDDMKKNEDDFKQELTNDYKMDGQTRRMFIVALEEACED